MHRTGGTYNRFELIPVLLPRCPLEDLLEQGTGLRVCYSCTLDISSVVELHRRVGLLERLGQHGLLRWWPAMALAVAVAVAALGTLLDAICPC